MEETWTILKVLDWTASRFEREGLASPRLDAQVLLAHVLECDRVALYTSFDKPLASSELTAFRALIKRRLRGEPVAYLVGHQEFWSLSFSVDSRVLIPRRDSETLIQAVLESCRERSATSRIADVATGSGALAVALAKEFPHAAVVATDLSGDALAVAELNARRHGLDGRIDFRCGDLLAPLAGERFNLVVSNLPYVRSGEIAQLSGEVQREPRMALDGGPDGLELIRRLIAGIGAHLDDGALVVLEHGFDQGQEVLELMKSSGLFVNEKLLLDLAGNPRACQGTSRSTTLD